MESDSQKRWTRSQTREVEVGKLWQISDDESVENESENVATLRLEERSENGNHSGGEERRTKTVERESEKEDGEEGRERSESEDSGRRGECEKGKIENREAGAQMSKEGNFEIGTDAMNLLLQSFKEFSNRMEQKLSQNNEKFETFSNKIEQKLEEFSQNSDKKFEEFSKKLISREEFEEKLKKQGRHFDHQIKAREDKLREDFQTTLIDTTNKIKDDFNERVKIVEDDTSTEFNRWGEEIVKKEKLIHDKIHTIQNTQESYYQQLYVTLPENNKQIEQQLSNLEQTCERDIQDIHRDMDLLDGGITMTNKKIDDLKLQTEQGLTGSIQHDQWGQTQVLAKIWLQDRKLHLKHHFDPVKDVSPLPFIKEVKNYFNKHQGLVELYDLIANNVSKNVSTWVEMHEEAFQNLERFEEKFRNKYWGRNQQDEVKEWVLEGGYFKGNVYDPEVYIIKLYQAGRSLDEPIEEGRLIKRIMEHFNKNFWEPLEFQEVESLDLLIRHIRKHSREMLYKHNVHHYITRYKIKNKFGYPNGIINLPETDSRDKTQYAPKLETPNNRQENKILPDSRPDYHEGNANNYEKRKYRDFRKDSPTNQKPQRPINRRTYWNGNRYNDGPGGRRSPIYRNFPPRDVNKISIERESEEGHIQNQEQCQGRTPEQKALVEEVMSGSLLQERCTNYDGEQMDGQYSKKKTPILDQM